MIAKSKIVSAKNADASRHKPNPLGQGYLTRNERWNEVIRYTESREAAK